MCLCGTVFVVSLYVCVCSTVLMGSRSVCGTVCVENHCVCILTDVCVSRVCRRIEIDKEVEMCVTSLCVFMGCPCRRVCVWCGVCIVS